MELNLIGKSTTVALTDSVFNCDFNEPLVHQVVTAYLAAGRAGSKAQKSRSEVRGGGVKPWKQKGTGRARAGSIRSPIWRSGGVTFAAKPRNFTQKLNKKMYRAAMRAIFSELIRQQRLLIVDEFSVPNPKTKELLKKLTDMKLKSEDSILIITSEVDKNLYLAVRNLPKVEICDAIGANPVNLVGFNKVLVTLPVIKKIEEMFG